MPFFVYTAVFLMVPTLAIAYSAFTRNDETGSTALTLNNIGAALQGTYLIGLRNSVVLAAATALVSGLSGFAIAYAVQRSSSAVLRGAVSTMSAVLAVFGGLPLALLFIAAIGNAGVITNLLQTYLDVSLSDDLHFQLYSLIGVGIVYLYFLIPLMVLVITPALEGVRAEWQEAATSLGASNWFYWRHVLAPTLMPNILGATALLFCTALAAHSTASAISNGTITITPLQIDIAVSSEVLGDQSSIADSLALILIVMVLPLTMAYQLAQKRTARWLQ
jgi:putative spermidine/putrescine transport system permease protein